MVDGSSLVGTWELVEYVVDLDSGERRYPLGRGAVGLIIYTAEGWMSVQVAQQQRDTWSPPSTASTAQRADAWDTYLAYAGRFDVVASAGTVTHEPVLALLPSWVGQDQVRHAELSGELLTLRTDRLEAPDGTAVGKLVWRRVPAGR